MATEIRQDTFDSFIAQSDKPVLVDFWATWCGPCRMLAPVVEQVSEENADKLAVGKVNVDDCPDLAMKFGVMSIPTLILFKDGQIVDKRIGYQPKNALDDMIRKAF
ncbi:MAG: thioredoxin [Aristaeellaceae bacterium]